MHRPINAARRFNRAERGFTIIELMIVITIIMILMTIAAGRYTQSVIRAKETALHQDLFRHATGDRSVHARQEAASAGPR